jgi:hypothetical protein
MIKRSILGCKRKLKIESINEFKQQIGVTNKKGNVTDVVRRELRKQMLY